MQENPSSDALDPIEPTSIVQKVMNKCMKIASGFSRGNISILYFILDFLVFISCNMLKV